MRFLKEILEINNKYFVQKIEDSDPKDKTYKKWIITLLENLTSIKDKLLKKFIIHKSRDLFEVHFDDVDEIKAKE